MQLVKTSSTSLFFTLFHEGEIYEVEFSKKDNFKIVCLMRKETERYWLQLPLSSISFTLLPLLLEKQKALINANKHRKQR